MLGQIYLQTMFSKGSLLFNLKAFGASPVNVSPVFIGKDGGFEGYGGFLTLKLFRPSLGPVEIRINRVDFDLANLKS